MIIFVILQLISLAVQVGCLYIQLTNQHVGAFDILGGYAIWGCFVTLWLGEMYRATT